MSSSKRPCTYCGIELSRFEKQSDGKWKKWDTNNNEHTYQACKAIQKNKTTNNVVEVTANTSPVNESGEVLRYTGITKIPTYQGGTSTFSQNTDAKLQGVTINSVFVKASNLEKEVKELRKQIETSASVIDGMAQKIELILAKTGYPGPTTITDYKEQAAARPGKTSTELLREQGSVMGSKEEIPDLNKDLEAEADRLRKLQQIDQIREKLEKFQNQGTDKIVDTLKEVGELTPLPPISKEGMQAFQNTQEMISSELQEEGIKPKDMEWTRDVKPTDWVPPNKEGGDLLTKDGSRIDMGKVISKLDEAEAYQKEKKEGWSEISEAFVCHSCENKTHNGFMNYAGTKICSECKTNIVAQQEINKEPETDVKHLRSISDINDDL